MMQHSPLPTTHPTIQTATWTKVTVLNSGNRRYLSIFSLDQTNAFRIEKVSPGLTDAQALAAFTSTSGIPLSPGAGGLHGDAYHEYTNFSTGSVWAYQASGGDLATLYVMEGV